MSSAMPAPPEPPVSTEAPEFVASLRADAITIYQPANSHELFAVERIVLAQLSMRRAAALEARLFADPMPDPATLAVVLRYQAQAERLYRRAVEDFERLLSLRPTAPCEPADEDPAVAAQIPARHTPESAGPRPRPLPVSNRAKTG